MIEALPVYRCGELAAFTYVDADDFERLSAYRWTMGKDGVPRAMIDGRNQTLHREVAGLLPGEGKAVHHINEDRFDNRRDNLKVCADRDEHGAQPHPRKEALVRAKMRLIVAENPGWPRHVGSVLGPKEEVAA